MPAKRELSMRQLRHLLRLHHDGVSAREIGRRLGVARSTIQDNLKRTAAVGLAWPLADDVTDEALEHRLFGRAGAPTGQRRRVEPNWAALARELKRPGVTMTILWEEYREVHPEGYGYSRFCDLLRGFERRLTPVMRQHHVAGDKAFVDYSGKRIGIEAAAGGGLALLKTGDRVRIDLKRRTANILISDAELNERRAALAQQGGYHYPKSQTPWQQIQREMVAQFDEGMVLKPAVDYQRLAQTMGVPRDNH